MATPQEVVVAHAYRAVIEDRISQLWSYRKWYRQHNGWLVQDRVEHMAELHYLIGIARKARRLSAPAVERADPITAAKATRFDDEGTVLDYHAWQAAYR